MNNDAMILMISTMSTVTLFTLYFFYKVLMSQNKEK